MQQIRAEATALEAPHTVSVSDRIPRKVGIPKPESTSAPAPDPSPNPTNPTARGCCVVGMGVKPTNVPLQGEILLEFRGKNRKIGNPSWAGGTAGRSWFGKGWEEGSEPAPN